MEFKRQVKAEESVNLTPLIDVVFLLLIFFMVSTTFTKESHLEVNLPEAVGEQSAAKIEFVEVIVGPRGGYSINGRALVNNQLATLRSGIETIAGGNNSLPFVITGDAGAPYQSVVSVMDLAGQMGFSKLSMTTKIPAESEAAEK